MSEDAHEVIVMTLERKLFPSDNFVKKPNLRTNEVFEVTISLYIIGRRFRFCASLIHLKAVETPAIV